MRNWLQDKQALAEGRKRVAVVHCKAGKGRSGTVSCSYLISEEGWTAEEAMRRFTDRRMRPGFGAGISIPSQVRTVKYVERWARRGKLYVERMVEVAEIHVWGLRDGVKVAVEGYVEDGKVIKTFHTFSKSEREIVRGSLRKETGLADAALEILGRAKKQRTTDHSSSTASSSADSDGTNPPAEEKPPNSTINTPSLNRITSDLRTHGDVIFRPSTRIVLPSNDVNIDFERRNKSKYGGLAMVTAVAHVWFNAYFEGRGPEQDGRADDEGVFEIDWDAMDGIKGSSRKGTRAFDRMAVVWKVADQEAGPIGVIIREPAEGEEVLESTPAQWTQDPAEGKRLGLRAAAAESAAVSRASSFGDVKALADGNEHGVLDEMEGVKMCGPDGEEWDEGPRKEVDVPTAGRVDEMLPSFSQGEADGKKEEKKDDGDVGSGLKGVLKAIKRLSINGPLSNARQNGKEGEEDELGGLH